MASAAIRLRKENRRQSVSPRFLGRAHAVVRRIALRARVGRPWAQVADVLARYGNGELAGATAISRLLLIYRDVELLRQALGKSRGGALAGSARDLLSFLDSHRNQAEETLGAIVDDDIAPAASLEEGLDRYRRRFNEAVRANAAASVALYSVGDEHLLGAATEEAARLMVTLGIVAEDRHLLDFGCGIGRFEAVLSSRVASITGIDVSPGMVAKARERCAGLANVRLLETSGQDLGAFADSSFDTVIAVDSFPYLYKVGGCAFALRQLEEVARVLRPGGNLLILNLSYRDDLEADRADARRFAADLGFELLRNGVPDLASWDGKSFHLRKRPARS